jgi:DNA (cytosine-5)-methyltransferase 1
MAEIAAVPESGLTVVSTFSGAGGSCLGYRMAGFRVLWANDFHPNAAESYRLNHPGTIVDARDVREISGSEILEAVGLAEGEVDLLDGSPPCQSFSSAGKRQKKWGASSKLSDGTEQRSDDLFFEFARLLGELRPRAFVAENVAGLVRGVAKGYFVEIVRALEAHGYIVESRLLDAQWLGVPQTRSRVIIAGVRSDLGRRPAFPDPLPYRHGVADACPWLASRRNEMVIGNDAFEPKWGSTRDPTPTLCATLGQTSGMVAHWVALHDTGTASFSRGALRGGDPSPAITVGVAAISTPATMPPDLGVDEIDRQVMPISESLRKKWETLRPGQSHHQFFNLRRTHKDLPAGALCASWGQGSGIHQELPPFQPRKFTIFEVKRLCSFPDDFQLVGTFAERWARLGNSVPPLMMRAIAEAMRPVLEEEP